MIFVFFKLLLMWCINFGRFWSYYVYDKIIYVWRCAWRLFDGWGIHLFTGKFGKGKTMLMCILAYRICKKKKQVTVLTNLELTNFPSHTRVLKLRTAQDILNAPKNTIVLIDEIGTIFNSRDFSGGKTAVPKPLFQHLSQCRKRRMMIFGTVQRFNLLDKQIRDISATVTECKVFSRHPFSRMVIGRRYDIEDYEYYMQHPDYKINPFNAYMFVQTEHYRHLYDTTDLISGFLKKDYISDDEIIRNQAYDQYGGEVLSLSDRNSKHNVFSRRRHKR